MIVLLSRVFYPKMIIRVQMFVDFVDVEIIWHTKLFGKIFYINKVNKHLNSNNHFELTPVGLLYLYHVWGPAWIEIHWNSIWLRAWSHMTSHYTWGSSYMILRVSWDGLGTLSFELSQFHGHGSWLMCEVSLRVGWTCFTSHYFHGILVMLFNNLEAHQSGF
jgi:hypothetical protein